MGVTLAAVANPIVKTGRKLLEDSTATTTTATVYTNFYDDPYNKAMYLVLPIMILVYGGCGAIYCIAKLRRYAKRKKRERLIAKTQSDSNRTMISPFVIDTDDDDFDEEEYIRPKQEKPSNPLVEMVGKKKHVMSPPFGEPPPYSPEPKACYMNQAYVDDYSAPTIHVFQQPDSPDVPRSAPASRAGRGENHEMAGLDPFHMPRHKKKKRLVFIAI